MASFGNGDRPAARRVGTAAHRGRRGVRRTRARALRRLRHRPAFRQIRSGRPHDAARSLTFTGPAIVEASGVIMTRRTKIWIIAAVVLLLYVIAAIVTGRLLHPSGGDAWLLRGGLTALGVISAALILWFFRDRTPAGPASPAEKLAAEVEQIFNVARTQRAAAKPENANVWFANGTIVAEAGSPVLATSDGWRSFVRLLRPRSLLAALTGKPQASSLAVVCYGCDELVKAGNAEAVAAAGRALRERLGEASTELGVQLPTYVLFTKADSIPHFEAFVRNFSADESREPLGAALPPDIETGATYTERATPRLERAMQDIYRSLARRRLPVLAREHAAEWKPAAYEFPREMRKLAPLVVEFLREVGKPSALKGSPVLRGFYFTGVQAVFVSDGTPEYTPAMQQQAREVVGARSATGVFSAQQLAATAAAAAAPSSPRTRKVPRWDFLPRLFREVILADEPAVRLTQGGERAGFLRR